MPTTKPLQLNARGYPVNVIRVADYVDLASNGILTNESVIANDPDLVRSMLRATLRGISDTIDDPDAAFEISKKYIEGLDQLSAADQDLQRAVLAESIEFWKTDRPGLHKSAGLGQYAGSSAGDGIYCGTDGPSGRILKRVFTLNPILTAHDLSMEYPNGNGGLKALDAVTFSALPNEFVCVVGPSGSGKSTLLRLVAGLLNPTRGAVEFEGQRVKGPRRRIGFVFQDANLMPWRSALANVELPLEIQGADSSEKKKRAKQLLKLVGLVDFRAELTSGSFGWHGAAGGDRTCADSRA